MLVHTDHTEFSSLNGGKEKWIRSQEYNIIELRIRKLEVVKNRAK